MASVTHTEFGADTPGSEVAAAFSSSVRDKTILITGANVSGISFSAAQAIVPQNPRRLILAGRNPATVQACIDALKDVAPAVDYRPLEVDFSEQKSVRDAAAHVLAWSDVPSIDIVINCAGIMGIPQRTLTTDGVELHLATNHVGHWLLSCLLMPKLINAAKSNPQRGATRIVNISAASAWWGGMRWSDPTFATPNKDLPADEQPDTQLFEKWGYTDVPEASYLPLDGYNRSKVANVLSSIGVARRLFAKHGIWATSVHPGVMKTDLGRHFPPKIQESVGKMIKDGLFHIKSLEAGSSTMLVAALDPRLSVGVGGSSPDGAENWGSFLEDCQISDKASPQSVSSEAADRLWAYSEELVGQTFAW